MNKPLKFKAVEVLRNNHKFAQFYVSFRINYRISIYDRFEWKAEEPRNEDLDFEEKNKWKFVKSQVVLLPVMKLFRELQVIDTFASKHRLYNLPINSFQHWFCLLSYTKIYNSSFELSQEWVIKGNKFGGKNLIEFETSVTVLCSYSAYSETKRDITREITKRRSFKEKQR